MICCTRHEIKYQCFRFSFKERVDLLIFHFLAGIFLSYEWQRFIESFDVLVFYCCIEFRTVFAMKPAACV